MEKPTIFLVLALLLNLKFMFAQGQPDGWIGIDCGSNRSTPTFDLVWETDEEYIKSGTNYLIPEDSPPQALAIFKTLRVFRDQNKNCYTLPTDSSSIYGYFIRAAFLYANYDGLSRPPTFDLEIDGNKWASVNTDSAYNYYEILYWPQNANMSVCLARTQEDQFPFISSLEAWPISYGMYTTLSQDMGWMKSYRYDYGPGTGILGYLGGDKYNRIWEAISVAGSTNTSGGSSLFSCHENTPTSAVEDAIQSQDNATSLFLSFSPVRTATPIYVEAYFTQTLDMGLISEFEMYVAGNSFGTINPESGTCTAQWGFVQVSDTNLTIQLQPTAESALPPIISAIEVYTATDPLITTGTDRNDLKGVMSFTYSFDGLKGWTGEPCLPADTVWQWLGCAPTHPPRVTSLYLSGYQLNGTLPNFTQMQALVYIDLSRNHLSGQIPAFLGDLPNLTTLNLSYNDFYGEVPASIRNNRRLKYDINGNPNLDSSHKDGISKATIIGLAVGIPLLLAAIALILLFWILRKRPSMGQQHEEEGDDYIEVNAKPNMVPDMELDELEELIDQYANEAHHPNDDGEDDDCVVAGEHVPVDDQSMVPDLDLEELHDIIQQQKENI